MKKKKTVNVHDRELIKAYNVRIAGKAAFLTDTMLCAILADEILAAMTQVVHDEFSVDISYYVEQFIRVKQELNL